jgi:hypothetical protein
MRRNRIYMLLSIMGQHLFEILYIQLYIYISEIVRCINRLDLFIVDVSWHHVNSHIITASARV